jgi:hypothetical protein
MEEEKLIQKHNEEIEARAELVYENYKKAGYSEEFCLKQKENFINKYKQ